MATQPPKKPSFSLYADLLEPDKQKASSATISGAPVKYDVRAQGGEDEGAKKKDASLKFQPIKRPQVPQKAKTKPTSSSSSLHKFSSSTVTATAASASSPEKSQLLPSQQQQPSVQQSNFEDWVGDDDDYSFQDSRPKAERGGRKKKKKNKAQERVWDWDDIYDPTLPNNYADYKGSEEQAREIRDWKARLYYRQLKEAKKAGKNGAAYSDEEAEIMPRPMNSMFAPPSTLNFAPPSFDEAPRPTRMEEDDDGDDYYPPDALSSNDRERTSYNPPPTFARASVPDDASGEDAYMRRMRMSGMASTESPAPGPPPPPPAAESAPTPPPVANPDTDIDAKRAEAAAKIAAFKAKLAEKAAKPAATDATPNVPTAVLDVQPPPPPPPPPEQEAGTTISRAPVRYNVPPPPANPENENTPTDPTNRRATSTPPAEQAKSSRPGQKGFAERLLKRYGWEKGQGLGASGEGITTAIVAKAEKRKKRSDAEGGGWVAPANMGKIVGGKKRKPNPEDASSAEPEGGNVDGKFGPMSEVVKLTNMLTGLDVRREIEEKNLMQEIGEEMQGQYGNVERVFIWREEVGGGNEVFVKFTSPLSALRAVRGMDGAVFAENEVLARFWDGGMFERGEFA